MKSPPIPLPIWQKRAQDHLELVSPMTNTFIARRTLGKSHPVHDFLFTYYPFSPQKLKQWVPAFNECLVISDEIDCPWLNDYWFERNENILAPNTSRIHRGTLKLAEFILELCESILQRPPPFWLFWPS